MSFILSQSNTTELSTELIVPLDGYGHVQYNHMNCLLCGYNEESSEEMFYDMDNPLSERTTVTAPCCQSILCPKCISVDCKKRTVKTNHLFIKSVIYEQLNEEAIHLVNFDGANCDDVQYRWGLYKPFDVLEFDTHTHKDQQYNSYRLDKIYKLKNEPEDDDAYYSCIHALCECKTCGFQCTALNYMDS